MKHIITALALIVSSQAQAGDCFNNGGGMSEAAIAYGMARFEQLTTWCAETDLCTLDATQKQHLRTMIQVMPSIEDLPVFLKQEEAPERFVIAGETLAFSTDARPGAQLYFNLDAIYHPDDFTGVLLPLSTEEATELLIQALSTQIGISRQEGVTIAAKIKAGLSIESDTTWLSSYGHPNIGLKASKTREGKIFVLMEDGSQIVDILEDVKASVDRAALDEGYSSVTRITDLTAQVIGVFDGSGSIQIDVNIDAIHNGNAIRSRCIAGVRFNLEENFNGVSTLVGDSVGADSFFRGNCN